MRGMHLIARSDLRAVLQHAGPDASIGIETVELQAQRRASVSS